MKRVVASAFFSAALVAGGGVAAAEPRREVQWGVTFGFYAPTGYTGSDRAKEEIDAIAAAGANWVTVVPIVWQDSYCSDFQYKDFALSQSDIDLKDAIDYIHSRGMKVQLRPMLECKDGIGRLGVWMIKDRERMPGRICDHRAKWFKSMAERSVYYARIAERTKCELFCLDSELDKMVEENEKWKSVVAAVREVYSGPVTSCHTLHTGAVDFKKFLSDREHWFYDLDFLSISYYCPARKREEFGLDLSPDDMKERLSYALANMREIAEAYGRPLLFGECGCTSSQDGAATPSGYASKDAPADEVEQARYMEALFRTFKDEPWCLGFHWWKWDQHSPAKGWEGAAGLARDFTFRGKKAEAVFRSFAAASSSDADMPDGKKAVNLHGAFPGNIKTVGVVMPASICKKPAFDVYVAALEEAGYKVKLAPRLDFERVAPAEDRAKDFEEMWMDPEVDLVICARGGKGADQVLPLLDWNRLRTRKQRVLGFSNITWLLNAMAKEKAGEPFSGPTMSQFRYCDRATLSWLDKTIARAKMPEVKLRPLRAGACEGLACGGHIAIFRDAVKAGQVPSAKGRIVFLECVNRTPEEVENALSEMADCGYFRDAAGVVFGDITVCNPASKVEEVKKAFVEKALCPVFDGYPYGHVPRSFAIDFNRRHMISADGVMTLE